MAFKRAKARIGEKSTTSGNGPWTLGGAFDLSYQTFASFLSDGDTTEVHVVEPGVAGWTGIGTYTAAGGTISPTSVEETWGTFGSGTKEIFAGPLASRHLVKEDIAGAIVTGGTSTAYTVSSFRNYDTLVRLHNQPIAFTPHVINGQTVTLNVDGLGAKPLRKAPGVELQSNVLIAGTPYTALYNNADGAFYLHAFGDAPGLPIGAGCDYFAATTPSTHFAFPTGQAISRTSFAALFALIGTTYGAGDGSTTFNLPDLPGRARVMKEASASRLTATYFGGNSTVLGATGGAESHTLITAETPSHQHAVFLKDPGHGHAAHVFGNSGISAVFQAGSGVNVNNLSVDNATTGITIGSVNGTANDNETASVGGGTAHAIVQPTIVCNYIFRVI